MTRGRSWRRWKNLTKARRKHEIDLATNIYTRKEANDPYYPYPVHLEMYLTLHQYSKNKVHCSCPMCSPKTRNKGKRKRKNYAPALNYRPSDRRRIDSLKQQEQERS